MRAQITDSRALRQVSPILLNKYLEIQGWSRQDTWRDRIVVRSLAVDDGVLEALVPLREESDVYAARISQILEILESAEHRSQLDIYYDVIGAGADIVRIQSTNGQGTETWSLVNSADFLTQAKNLMMASARSAEQPGRPIYPGRPSSQVQEYVSSLRTLPGHDAWNELTIHSLVPAHLGAQAALWSGPSEPFPRLVVRSLNDSLQQVQHAVQEAIGKSDISAFEEAAQKGVSANLCEAVASLVRQTHGLKIQIAWASTRAEKDRGADVMYGQSTADVLADGAQFLRGKNPILNALVRGEIVRLDKETQEEFDGKAVVVGTVDDEILKLDVQFDLQDRDEVLRAFRDGLEIRVSGNIQRHGRRFELRELVEFVVGDKLSDEEQES